MCSKEKMTAIKQNSPTARSISAKLDTRGRIWLICSANRDKNSPGIPVSSSHTGHGCSKEGDLGRCTSACQSPSSCSTGSAAASAFGQVLWGLLASLGQDSWTRGFLGLGWLPGEVGRFLCEIHEEISQMDCEFKEISTSYYQDLELKSSSHRAILTGGLNYQQHIPVYLSTCASRLI